MHADLVFYGGAVHTMDPGRPQAEAVATAGDRIIAVGATTDVLAHRGPTTLLVNLAGRALVPGFYDAHQHQVYMGLSFREVNARTASIEELVGRVRERALGVPGGTWIQGSGYDDNKMAEHRHPDRWDLDRATADHPVFLTRMCGHVMALNSLALAKAGISRDTPDPAGGGIDRDAQTGEPTGILRETAMEHVRRVVPLPSAAELETAILEAAQLNLSLGITSVWEPSVEPDHVRAYRDLEADGRLPVRVTMAHKKVLRSGEHVPLPRPFRGPWLSLQAIKLFQDGGIGPRTAALSEPYTGEAGNRGLLRWSQAELDALVDEIHRSGLKVSIHAIGDAAIGSAISALEAALAGLPRPDHRHRIEHCGVFLPPLHRRLARLQAIPVVQPSFLYYDGDVYMRNVGPRRSRWIYPILTFLQLGLAVAGSSDGPVVPSHAPLLGIRTALTRRTVQGQIVTPEERLSFTQALSLFTLGAAIADGAEQEKGSISAGKFADLVVLGGDPALVHPEGVAEIPVEMTIVGGRTLFES
jgi:predicted amidohydrolase YtcJ